MISLISSVNNSGKYNFILYHDLILMLEQFKQNYVKRADVIVSYKLLKTSSLFIKITVIWDQFFNKLRSISMH